MNRLSRIVGIVLVAAGAAATALAQVSAARRAVAARCPAGHRSRHRYAAHGATRRSTEARKLRVRELLRTERATVEADPDGQPILRRQVGALSPYARGARTRARGRLHACCARETLDGLGLTLVVLQAPEDLSTRRALKKLRELDPRGPVRLQPSLSWLRRSQAEAAAALAVAPAAAATARLRAACASA